MASRNRARVVQLVEPIALATAGVAVLATARLRWIGEGAGSTLDGAELADSLRNGALVPDWGAWVAAGLYVLVGLGGLLLASSGFSGPIVAAVRLSGGIAVVASFVVAAVAGWFPTGRWSYGPALVLAAAVVAVAVSCSQLSRHRRKGRRELV
jgi:hypothetical protein